MVGPHQGGKVQKERILRSKLISLLKVTFGMDWKVHHRIKAHYYNTMYVEYVWRNRILWIARKKSQLKLDLPVKEVNCIAVWVVVEQSDAVIWTTSLLALTVFTFLAIPLTCRLLPRSLDDLQGLLQRMGYRRVNIWGGSAYSANLIQRYLGLRTWFFPRFWLQTESMRTESNSVVRFTVDLIGKFDSVLSQFSLQSESWRELSSWTEVAL